ncbi:MAG TPA: L,D-transpeptidase family protein [Alphaproteobacteria bacterium]|nr:L,D-transpeptidase family protein [Alphaproteobacteria bacterium]
MDILVTPAGRLSWNGRSSRCALGPSGIRADKREGDGATPAGAFPLRRVLYRADRLAPPPTRLAVAALAENDAWCDDPKDPRYNQQLRLPYPASHEHLWRGDHLYDVIVVLGYNDAPVVPGRGSAIFLHVARPDYGPTAGCVALALADLLALLAAAGLEDRLVVSAA